MLALLPYICHLLKLTGWSHRWPKQTHFIGFRSARYTKQRPANAHRTHYGSTEVPDNFSSSRTVSHAGRCNEAKYYSDTCQYWHRASTGTKQLTVYSYIPHVNTGGRKSDCTGVLCDIWNSYWDIEIQV
jgi:hypothetical protein